MVKNTPPGKYSVKRGRNKSSPSEKRLLSEQKRQCNNQEVIEYVDSNLVTHISINSKEKDLGLDHSVESIMPPKSQPVAKAKGSIGK